MKIFTVIYYKMPISCNNMVNSIENAHIKGSCGNQTDPTHTASLYELAFTATRSVSGQCCEVKQPIARLVAGWVTQALEQGRLGSSAHAGYHQYYNGVGSV